MLSKIVGFISPYAFALKLAAIVITMSTVFWAGKTWESNKRDAAELVILDRALESFMAQKAKSDKLALDLIAEQQKKKVVYKTITKEVPKYVTIEADSNCPVPDGFVGLWNDASQATLPNPASGASDGS